MAFFFAIAGSEVWEALLPGGALSNPKKAATPLLATVGGLAGPAAIYIIGCYALGRGDITNGWAIPCATDIAFSYLVARFIFGQGHPAIAFLLLLAIADDAAGLVILAIFYPSGKLHLTWLLASAPTQWTRLCVCMVARLLPLRVRARDRRRADGRQVAQRLLVRFGLCLSFVSHR